MKKINIVDIRKGDKIRFERDSSFLSYSAIEYKAVKDGQVWNACIDGVHYLLERPEKPFKPGTVVRKTYNTIGNALWVRREDAWFFIPGRGEYRQDPRKSGMDDRDISCKILSGELVILSEPS